MKYPVLFIIMSLILFGCSKQNNSPENTDILSYAVEGKPAQVSIIPSSHDVNIRFPDSVMNADNLIADFTLSPGCKATIQNDDQVSGVTKNDYSTILFYTVATSNSSVDWKVTSTNNTYTAAYGLGNFLQQTVSNNCSYSWYIDQQNTGFDANDNCGPTCVTMACMWADSAFRKTPAEARMAYRPLGGWWYTTDIDGYLRDNSIIHTTISLSATAEGTAEILKHQIDVHQIVLLCLDMNLVRFTDNMHFHTDKFYTTTPDFGHFIIVKGYKKVDNETFFEVYDPNSWGAINDDGMLMGQNRYYRYQDLFEATKIWWPFAFIIAKNGAALTGRPAPLNNKNIPVQYGK